MDFGYGDVTSFKAWRDIWGAGQGFGAVTSTGTARELVDRLRAEYREAAEALANATDSAR